MKNTLRNLSQKSIKLDLVWYCANLSLQLNRIRFPFLIKKAIAATLRTDTSLPQNPNPPHHVSLPTLMHFCVIKRWGWEFWVKLFVETTFINWLWRIRKTSPKYIPCSYITQTWVTIGHFTLWLNKGKRLIWIIQFKWIWEAMVFFLETKYNTQEYRIRKENHYSAHKPRRQNYKWWPSSGTPSTPKKESISQDLYIFLYTQCNHHHHHHHHS